MEPIYYVRTYDDLREALRVRCKALKVSRETIDEIAGLGSCYTNKLMAPVPVKNFGRISLGAMLGAMGVMLVLVEDMDALERVERRLRKAKNPRLGANADARMPTLKKRPRRSFWRGNSQWGKMLRLRAISLQSELKRSQLATKAAKVRWSRAACNPANGQPLST